MMTTDAARNFVSWGFHNLPELRNQSAEEAAESIGNELLTIDQGLGVEVSDICHGEDRELIVTAFSDPALFSLVRDIVQQLSSVPGWRVIALKPPRGFEFTLTVGKQRVHAKNLEFTPIPSIVAGVRLLVAQKCLVEIAKKPDSKELAWLIVETGIGEELSSKLQLIEFGSNARAKGKQPITKLAEYVENAGW